jgi:hypothetical protein
MSNKVLIMGGTASALMLQKFKEQYGEDVEVYTPEEAQAQGLGAKDFGNLPRFEITAPPIIPMKQLVYKDGKANRRARRKNLRKK